MKTTLILFIALAAAGWPGSPSRVSFSSQPETVTTPDRLTKWHQDLDFLINELPAKHKNAFFHCPKDQWLARAEELRTQLPTLSDQHIFVELRRLVALLGDAHTGAFTSRNAAIPAQRAYPIATVWLADGVYAPILPKEHATLIGQRLVRIGACPIDDAITRLAELRAFDNDSGRKHNVMQDLRDVDSLVRLAIVADENAAPFTFVDADGKETTITLAPIPPSTDWTTLITQRPDTSSLPAWRATRRFPYGHEYLPDSQTFYIWYDTCSNHADKTVATFIEETITALDTESAKKPGGVNRVIVDFRRNGGGNSIFFMPMIEQLARRDALKEKGRLIALIGRRTFSSGMMNAYQLRNATRCLLMGEPTGGTPNGYGEVRSFTLPNSKLIIQYSTKLFRGVTEDTNTIAPDILVETTAKDYFEARDTVLQEAIDWKP